MPKVGGHCLQRSQKIKMVLRYGIQTNARHLQRNHQRYNRSAKFQTYYRRLLGCFLAEPKYGTHDRHKHTRPDGYIIVNNPLIVEGEAVLQADIALSCEYKRNSGVEQLDDVSTHWRFLLDSRLFL
jgi:hypothetical protein